MTMLQTHWYGIDLRWAYVDLLSSISHRIHCRQLAKDVLHDALVRFALTTNPDREAQPHAYLRTIVRHLLIDSYHEVSRFVPFAGDDADAGLTPRDLARNVDYTFSPSAEHLADIQQRLHALQVIIDGLPARCKETFWLFRIEGMSQQDISMQLGISVNMVQRHIIRAMMDLLTARDLLD